MPAASRTALLCALLLAPAAARSQDWLDRLSDRLTLSTPDGQAALHFSGLLDLEGYALPQPAPGLLDTERHSLFNPRLTAFFDARLGPQLYAFGQARLDRGFDPGDRGARLRLDEYVLRWTPWPDGRFTVQAGQFATVAGTWAARHYTWDNAFILAPVPYENLTGVQDVFEREEEGAKTSSGAGDEYASRVPIIWGPDYATGLAVMGKVGQVDLAAEIKNTALSARPETWSGTKTNLRHPTVTFRTSYQPSPTWRFGVSGSSGAYLREGHGEPLPPRRDVGDYRQWVLGQDVTFAWRHTQVWAECYQARFDLPGGGHSDTLAYYVEGRQQLTTQLFSALRWNQQFYGAGPEGSEVESTAGPQSWRIDAAVGYRFTTHTQLKVQYSLEHYASIGLRNILAAQFTVKF